MINDNPSIRSSYLWIIDFLDTFGTFGTADFRETGQGMSTAGQEAKSGNSMQGPLGQTVAR